jgi:protein-S-isoprenylcysteine O-methyltransferase Ste14
MIHEMQSNRSDKTGAHQSFIEKGGVWVVGQFVVMAGLLVLTPLGHSIAHSPQLLPPAGLLLTIGAAAGIAGVLALGRSRTPFPKPRSDSQLVQTGVYSLVRHPLYGSLIMLSFGWACLWGSGLGAVLAVIQALFLDAKAQREERWLHQRFPDYAAYAAKVRRFIPWVY